MRCSLSMCVTFISSVLASRSSLCARLGPPSIEHSIGLRLPDETGISLFVVWFRQKVAPSRCVATFVELRHFPRSADEAGAPQEIPLTQISMSPSGLFLFTHVSCE